MERVVDESTGLALDINWVGAHELLAVVEQQGAAAWFMFLTGVTLCDPKGAVARCEAAIADWFDGHPAILAAWHQQQRAVEAFKQERTGTLEFATQRAFLLHLVAQLAAPDGVP